MTQPIRQPELLDPDRSLRPHGTKMLEEHEAKAAMYKSGLEATCAYAQQLWNDLDGMRTYLLDSLPPDPRAPGLHPTASASPTGPDDDEGWQRWVAAYATVTSVLAGPHGDSGFGLSEARREAELRRTAPVLTLQHEHPHAFSDSPPPAAAASPPAPPDPQPHRAGAHPAHTAATVALAVLALRGVRPRRRRTVR